MLVFVVSLLFCEFFLFLCVEGHARICDVMESFLHAQDFVGKLLISPSIWKQDVFPKCKRFLWYHGCIRQISFKATFLAENKFDEDADCKCEVPCKQVTYETDLSYADLSRVNLEPFVINNNDKLNKLKVCHQGNAWNEISKLCWNFFVVLLSIAGKILLGIRNKPKNSSWDFKSRQRRDGMDFGSDELCIIPLFQSQKYSWT